jgi:hypothetical protein
LIVSSKRHLGVFVVFVSTLFGCISKETNIGLVEDREPTGLAPPADARSTNDGNDGTSPVSSPTQSADATPQTTPSTLEPTDPKPGSNGSSNSEQCVADVLLLTEHPSGATIFEIYCEGSPGRPELYLDLLFENVSGMALSGITFKDGWRIVFASDGELVEAPSLQVFGGGPWELDRNQGSGDVWYSPEQDHPFSPAICSRCDEPLVLEALFDSAELGCIAATTSVGYLYCR